MKIVVVADTHKDYKRYKEIVLQNIDADLFIHLGDGEHEFFDVKKEIPEKEFIFVQGEADFGTYDKFKVVEAGNLKILCVHGNDHNVTQSLDPLINDAKYRGCKIALYGHTHLYRVENIDGVYIMNPGAVDSPRGKNRPSYGILSIDAAGNISMNIVAMK